jgi:tetrapyrrole methylase family protein / MazG family protein
MLVKSVTELVRMHETLQSIDVALNLLGIEPHGLQICAGDELRIDAQRPAFVTGPTSVADRKALESNMAAVYPAGHPVSLLSGLRTDSALVTESTIGQLGGSTFEALYIPALDSLADVRRFDGLFHIVIERLNAPDGCPWDNEQTHESLRPYLIEEAYELIEAIDEGDADATAEELGDVLLQILMHTAVARRSGAFSFGDVTETISRKMIERHPHVFAGEPYRPNWEDLKKKERPDRSALEGVPTGLPALAQSQSLQSRARKVGFDWPDIEGPLEKLAEELGEFARAESDAEREDEFGDIIFVVANIADHLGIDAEQALRLANGKFRRRFMRLEELARADDIDLRESDINALNQLWDQAKADLATNEL